MREIDYGRIDTNAVRKRLLLMIHSIACGGTAKTFGQATPYLDNLVELLSMWFDELYHDPQALVDDRIINPVEAEALAEFSAAFEQAYPGRVDPRVVDLNKLQDDAAWQSVIRAAKEAQAKLKHL